LNKQRKQVLRYILLDAEGDIFNQLVKNINYHSHTDPPVEPKQNNFPVLSMKTDADENATGSPVLCKEDGNQLTDDQKKMVKVL